MFPRSVDIDALLAATRPRAIKRSRMLRRRQLATLFCLAIAPGTLAVTLGYALYIRGDGYKSKLASSLSDRLGMAVSIDAVEPLGLRGRLLRGVRVNLDADGAEVFRCQRATWEPDHGDSGDGFTLTLKSGWILAGDVRWSRGEYERLLTGGLGHRFEDVGLSEVRVENLDIRFEGETWGFRAEDASGVLLFDRDGTGHASIDCERLNSVPVDQPVNIAARFTPGKRATPKFELVRLTVPRVSLAALGFGLQDHAETTHGTFDGTIVYEPIEGAESVRVSGSIRGADLSEHTHRLPGGPYSGSVTLELREAEYEGRRLKRLDLTGYVDDVKVGAIAPALVADGRDALLSLTIDRLRWENERLVRLAASGQCNDLSLEAVTSLIGKGTVTGTAAVDIQSLLVADDRLRGADVTITAIPPSDAPAIISREVIASAAERWLGVNPAAILPEKVQYLELGARFMVDGDQLRVRGTHGPDGATILTVQLLGRPIGLVRELDRTFTIPDVVRFTREYVKGVERGDVRDLWNRMHEDTQ